MTHVRQQIREAAVAALTGLKTTEDRVRSGAVWAIPEGEPPTLLVYDNLEDLEAASQRGGNVDGARLARKLSLDVRGLVQASEQTLEDTLDRIGAEVEVALMTSFLEGALGALLKDLQLVDLTKARSDEGAPATGGIIMTFEAVYETRERDPETAI